MNYLITGVAGTGKSTVAKELQKRGLAAYDADAGFSYNADKKTGEKTVRPTNPTLEWYEDHERVFSEKVLQNLFKKHANDKLYICSITANQAKYYPDFDKIFLLSAPDKIIVKRLETRTNNHYGKHPIELERVVSRHKEFDEELLTAGAITVDSTQPINQVVTKILEYTK